ncbi:MAG: DNA mismatch repair endonuclease MutL [Candidatus Omnitrophica bacterium]|jgi:DNA mismatch repair protein MutL|nr:DNA mismatch repair endonuclease MutL [Candidatus Omnitrophota bacterium]
MNKIHVLPPEIISKIAAGEVIERPASVLKELLENSLDAQADNIEVEIKGAGKIAISIKDNGTGIAEENMEPLCSRHATSKIASIDDLYNINSLGFRGEALYSISAVADVVLSSKTKDQDSGWEIHLRGGQKLNKKPAAMSTGTKILASELFYNTPARKKFLKSNTAEMNHILDIFIPYTLLYPQASFTLTHNEKTLLDLKPAQNHIQRISKALNLAAEHIIEDTREFPRRNMSMHLALGDINIQRARKDLQFIFVNNRPVQNRTLSFHLNEIYRMLFPPGTAPFFCLYLSLPADQLDVNVHPAKREVKIKDELEVVALLRPFCESLLMTNSKAKQAQDNIFPMPQATAPVERQDTVNPTPGGIKEPAGQKQYNLSLEENIMLFKTGDIFGQKKENLKEKLKSGRYLGNFHKKYLLFESGDSLLVVDQHAAQERITFERLKSQIENGQVEVEQLINPILLKLTPAELLLWEENNKIMEKIGFQTSLWDKETLAVHSHPRLIANAEISVRNLITGENIPKLNPEIIARRACRSSVMAGFSMNPEQAEYQRSQLLACRDPFTCPHGRPTVIEIPESSLSKQFLRT